jgi:hypothetical protein
MAAAVAGDGGVREARREQAEQGRLILARARSARWQLPVGVDGDRPTGLLSGEGEMYGGRSKERTCSRAERCSCSHRSAVASLVVTASTTSCGPAPARAWRYRAASSATDSRARASSC